MDNIVFQYYSGNIKHTRPLGSLNLVTFIDVHRNPTDKTVKLLNSVIENREDKVLKRKLKHQLHFFTPSVVIEGSRSYANIVRFTGLAQIDIDMDQDDFDVLLNLKEMFSNYEQCVTTYISPSRKGVKALFRIPICKTIDDYRGYYLSLTEEFESIPGFDASPKNAVLPLFISRDEDIYYNNKATEWTDKKSTVVEYVNVEYCAKSDYSYGEYYRDKTVNLFLNKINIVSGNGHPQLRSACLTLGSRVGAGYIDMHEALSVAENSVRSHGYFKKDLRNYLSTCKWAIEEGSKNPMKYKNHR